MEKIKVRIIVKNESIILELDKKYYGYLIKDEKEIPTVTFEQLLAGAYEEYFDKYVACVQPMVIQSNVKVDVR